MRTVASGYGAVALATAVACGNDGGPGEFRRPPADPTIVAGTTTVDPDSGDTAPTGEGEPCSAAMPCASPTFCAAPNAGGATVGVGEFTCSLTCVATEDPSRWCLDETSCCDAAAACVLGYCRVAMSTTTEDPTESSGSDATASSGSGTGTESTGGVGTDSGGPGTGSGSSTG